MHTISRPPARTFLGTDCLAQQEAKWLWRPYIPAGRITVLDGDPAMGKSFISLDLAARISKGAELPGGQPNELGPATIMICNCEDEVAVTMVPRLKAAGADLSRVVFCSEVGSNGDRRFLELPNDSGLLEDEIVRQQAKFVVIDPIMAFLGERVRTNSDQSVRKALSCLNPIAERTGATFLLVRHLNKSGGTKAIYRGGGSIGIIGLARSGLMVARNPNDASQTLFLHTKANLAKKGPTLRYQLAFKKATGVGVVQWRGQVKITADQALKEEYQPTEIEKAGQFLQAALKDGREMKVIDLMKQARAQGISPAAITRAKKKATVFVAKKGKAWLWSLAPLKDTTQEFLANLSNM